MIEIPSLTTVLSRLADRTIKDPSVNFRTMVELAGLSPTIDFVGASLQGIDFRDEDLRGFNFSNADLTGADFRRADITDANFEGASLIGAIGLDKKYINQGDEDADLRPPDFDARKV